MTDKTKAMWVECAECQHKWAAVYLPMEMSKVTRVMDRLICPNCAEGTQKIYICEAPEPK